MFVFSYVIPHDYGFAPNPYGGFLTLATCKPKIRKTATKGDFIVGTGSASTVGNDKLVYAAKISDVVSMADYGRLAKYKIKRPSMNGPLSKRHGDNIYFFEDDVWHQRANTFHGIDCLERDLSGLNVLICDRFWYFGDNAIDIPRQHRAIIKRGPGHKKLSDDAITIPFIRWLDSLPCGNHNGADTESDTQITNRCTCVLEMS